MSNDITVIYWKNKDVRPEEGNYILLKTIDENGQVVCEPAQRKFCQRQNSH